MTVIQDDLEALYTLPVDHKCELIRREKPGTEWEECQNPAAWILHLHLPCGHRPDTTMLVCQRCHDDLLTGDASMDHPRLIICSLGGCVMAAEIKAVEPLR